MTLDTQARLNAAQRLVKLVTGEPYGDGMTVADVGVGYAEPGYHDDETVWVLGDWNNNNDTIKPNDQVSWRIYPYPRQFGQVIRVVNKYQYAVIYDDNNNKNLIVPIQFITKECE